MRAYLICEKNLDEITKRNNGVIPAIRREETYYIATNRRKHNLIVTRHELNLSYKIIRVLDGRRGIFMIESKVYFAGKTNPLVKA